MSIRIFCDTNLKPLATFQNQGKEGDESDNNVFWLSLHEN